MKRTPQAMLSKLTAREKQHLADRLAQLQSEQRRLLASLEATAARIKRAEDLRLRCLDEGARAADIAALEAARESDIGCQKALQGELEALEQLKRQLLKQLYACDGKIKALDRMQERHAHRLQRDRERKKQQELADLLVHHRSRWR